VTSTWHFYKSCNFDTSCGSNAGYEYAQLGINGDVPVPASYLKQIGGSIPGYDLAKARLSPKNAIGGTNLYSRNFSWKTGLVSLPGRAGLDAGFGISYNSLIWTKQGSNIYFDADNSNVSPGFRFGFPVIEPVYYEATDSRTFNYLMVSPSGARTEFRQVNGASGTYETTDSSYTRLKATGASNPNEPENVTITVTGNNGTQMNFQWKAGAFRCSRIKDRNGNYIDVNHDEYGLLRTVVDTLGRVITVNYDSELYPISITQTWKNNNGAGSEVTHTWATFTYTTTTTNTSFAGLTVYGPQSGTNLKVLQKVTYPDNSSTLFNYNAYGQVWKVSSIAADSPAHILNYVRTNLETPASAQTDCPRFTETRTWTENFNLDPQGTAQEIVTTNSITENQAYSVPGASGTATLIEVSTANDPHQALTKTYVGASGWREALPIATEDWANDGDGLTRKRWTSASWTQDDVNRTYILNPRMTEAKVGDAANIKKTTVEYYPVSPGSAVALYGLVKKIQVSDGTTGTLLKEALTEYNLDAAYVSRGILGLPSKTEVSGLNQANNTFELVSKVTYTYDGYGFTDTNLEQNIPTVIQHDNTNYGAGFVIGRGNLTGMTRHNVTGATPSVTSSTKYNTAGAPVAQINPLGKTVKISYTDSFNDAASRNTYAYPTTLTDPAEKSSTVKYRFDIGENVWAKSPNLNPTTEGKVTARAFDSIGRLQRESVFKGNQAYLSNQEHAYTRYDYPANNVQSKIYTTVVDTDDDGADADDEVLSETWTDGAGRVLRSRTQHPGSTGGYTGTLTEYNILGQVTRSSVPTEINSSWLPAGDDSARGWLWSSQQYDWKGRTTRIIPPDSTGSDGKDQLFSYSGCGCAGGEVITAESELVPRDDQPTVLARRKQKIYSDILGRNRQTERYDWQGNIYETVVNLYNGRDQVISTRQYAGAGNSSNVRETLTVFDGHGRPQAVHVPEQDANKFTTYTYFADDKLQTVTDGRGATKHYAYNDLGLVQQISWTVPENSAIEVPASVSFIYDGIGNRAQMNDGFGTVVYQYNELSQLKSETRQFNETVPLTPVPNNNSFEIQYTYELAGQLASYKEPYGEVISYEFDKTGRFKTVSGNRTVENQQLNYTTNTDYRAWGAVKKLDYGNSLSMTTNFNNRLQAQQYDFGSLRLQYSYYNDGQLRSSDTDQGNDNLPNFDRLFQYDFLGRLTIAKTGAEARGQVENNPSNRPYRTTLEYNQFGDIINQQRLHWTASFNSSFQYQDSRMVTEITTKSVPNWVDSSYTIPLQYDADGRKIADVSGNQKYDAEGRIIYLPESDLAIKYDGDGRKIKTVEGICQVGTCPNLHSQTNFYIKSSVLDDYVSELSHGTRRESSRKTEIYGYGKQIAERRMKYIDDPGLFTDATFLQTTDPSGAEQTELALHISGNYFDVGGGTLDPFGAGVGYGNPYPSGTPDPNYPECDYGHDGEPADDCEIPGFEDPENEAGEVGSIFSNECYVNGFKSDCNEVMRNPDLYEEEPNHYKLFQHMPSGKYFLGLNSPTGYYQPLFSGNQVTAFGDTSKYKPVFEGFKFVQTNTRQRDVRIAGFNKDQHRYILSFIGSMATNEKCEEAFKAAGLTPVSEMVKKGLNVVHREKLGSEQYNSEWRGKENIRLGMKAQWETIDKNRRISADVTSIDAQEGQYYVSFGPNTWDGSIDTPGNNIIHSLIHAAGAPRRLDPIKDVSVWSKMTGQNKVSDYPPKHDLDWMNYKDNDGRQYTGLYDKIIEACTPKTLDF
jgi:hypothetical protein